MPAKFLTSRIIKFLMVMAVLLLLVFLVPQKIFNSARGIILEIAYPFQKTFYTLSGRVRETFEFLASISELKAENSGLIKENNQFLAQIAELENQKKENESLRRELELAPRKKFNLEASLVIGQDPSGPGSWIVIDKGRSSGIEVGLPVIVSQGILVGKISEVYPNSSKVAMLTDSASFVNVSDIDTGAKGIIKGEYGLGLVLNMVEQTALLNVGDSIVTSGLGGDLPDGLLIGQLQQIENTRDKLFQRAIVAPEIRYSDLDIVFVIKR